MLIKIFIALLIFYFLAMVAIYFAQTWFIYAPSIPSRKIITTPSSINLAYEEVMLETSDDENIHGWFIPSGSHSPDESNTVLFFHGNAGNISHRMETILILHKLGLNVFIIDYRGFGNSSGKPTELGTYLDAEAAWNYLSNTRNIQVNKIIIFGRSLGGGVGAELAKKVQPAMLILESTFTSMPDASAKHYPFMPTDLLVKHKYATKHKLRELTCPLLIIHSKDDEVIPYSHAKLNFALAKQPKKFIEINGGHGNGFLLSKKKYFEELQRALVTMLP